MARQAAGFKREYADINAFDTALNEEEELWVTASMPCNSKKNRYCDILPNEPTRFRLEGIDGGDYINCNVIDGPRCGVPHRYLCGQAPTIPTLGHWWHMIWQADASLILMLAKLVEKGAAKADRYWPKKPGPATMYGRYSVVLESEGPLPGFPDVIRRLLRVTYSGETRKVTHYQYEGWPDHGVPRDSGPFVELLRLTDAHLADRPTSPVVVHCSAGVGRTGVFLATHLTLTRLRLHRAKNGHNEPFLFNMVQTLCQLRWCRSRLIQTPEQYAFCYNVIIEQAMRMEDP